MSVPALAPECTVAMLGSHCVRQPPGTSVAQQLTQIRQVVAKWLLLDARDSI
jgi:hypothetical protein